jgi:hypothetical protein
VGSVSIQVAFLGHTAIVWDFEHFCRIFCCFQFFGSNQKTKPTRASGKAAKENKEVVLKLAQSRPNKSGCWEDYNQDMLNANDLDDGWL